MTGLLFAFFLCAVAFWGLRRFERASLYFPDREVNADPSGIGLNFEEINFKSLDGTPLHGWWIPPDINESREKEGGTIRLVGTARSRPVLLYFHGNGGNIVYRLDALEFFEKLGVNVFIFDWRGYGKSGGSPSEAGLRLDAQAAWNYLTRERGIEPSRIVLFGESLGGAVAAWLAGRTDAAGLIVESAPASVVEMAKAIYPFFPLWLVPPKDKYDTLAAIREVRMPKLIAHSREDDIVPYPQGRRVFEAAPEPKRFFELRGGHNGARYESGKDYEEILSSFIRAASGG